MVWVFAGALFALTPSLKASDWPQYRGPNQDGVSTEAVNLTWPPGGPKVLWKTSTKNGFSSFAVGSGRAFTQVNRELGGAPRELVVALDAASGKELWSRDVGLGKYERGGDSGAPDNKGGDGPRSTPTLRDGKVYVLNQEIVLHCLDAATGKPIWTRDIIKEHAGRNISWKSAASPVVDGNLVFVGGGGAGQSFLALDRTSGEVVWKTGDETITHATPVVATIHGVRQVICFAKSGLVSLATVDGRQLWRFPFKFSTSTAISPVVAGDIVYCSAGYGVGAAASRIVKAGDGFRAEELWKLRGDKPVANHWSTPVYRDGHLYGMFSFKRYADGPMKCVELATGKVKWEQPGFGAGQVILVQDKVVALTDYGDLVVVDATPTAYKEVGRAMAVEGKCWSTPALADGRLYVRSTKEAACLDLSSASGQ